MRRAMVKVLFSISVGVLATVLILVRIRVPTALMLDQVLQQVGLNPGGQVRSLVHHDDLPLCPEMPPNLRSNVQPEERRRILEKDPSILSHVQPGGTWRPRGCLAREHVAIIVPYRDREEHLSKFLLHIHHFLQKQQLHYSIFVAEMTHGTTFNTGMMQNLGFQIADAMGNFSCYVIHDVDLLPTNENNLYRCNTTKVIHPATNNSKAGYKKKYDGYIGGAVMVTRRQYYSVNGFSNLYFGWGGQDDDFRARNVMTLLDVGRTYNGGLWETFYLWLFHVGIPVYNVPMNIGVYEALSHGNDPGNPRNPKRGQLLQTIKQRMLVDGLNTLEYKLRRLELRPLYTWILVEVDQQKIMSKKTR